MGVNGNFGYACVFILVMMLFLANSDNSDAAAHRLLQEEVPKSESAHGKLGRQCTDIAPKLNSSSGAGSVVEIGGLKCYVSGRPRSKRAIILASDVYGYEAPNLRKLADKVAHAGFYAVVPDFFYGDPYNPNNTLKPLPVWKALHDPVKAFEASKPLIKALRSHGMSEIGTAGFCWGGKVAVEQAKYGLVQAGALLHPSEVVVDDMNDVKVPLAILGAEFDKVSCPPELVKKFKKVLSKLKIANFVKIFPGVRHGWTLRYQLDDRKAVKAANEAHKDTIKWFIKRLK